MIKAFIFISTDYYDVNYFKIFAIVVAFASNVLSYMVLIICVLDYKPITNF